MNKLLIVNDKKKYINTNFSACQTVRPFFVFPTTGDLEEQPGGAVET
jgi:hypothetical protein